MNGRLVLATYSEVALKSPPVRRRLENQLTRHIRKMLEREGLTGARVGRIQGRLTIEDVDLWKATGVVSKVFGIASVMPALRIDGDLDMIVRATVEMALQVIQPNQTFAVRARRTGNQSYTSKDIEVKAGAEILKRLSEREVRVNLENPDKTIHVEARGDSAYMYHQVLMGPSGLPFGSQGKLISLFSGGIDSPVATWLMMKRGAYVMPLFLDQRPFVGDDYCQRVENVARKIREYVPLDNYYLNIAPMGEIMKEIVETVPAKFICLVCKRMMYRIACGLAERKEADGIVTGESLGQVASQTLANLRVLDDVSPLPVYRPLVGFEKLEIVEFARRIGTYELSTIRVHGCSAVPSKPATRARLEDVKTVEASLDVEGLRNESLNKITTIPL